MKLIQQIEGCCAVVEEPLTAREADRVAAAFKVLGDPARLRLLSLIAAQPEGECCVCDLTPAVKLSQPTVSHHLKVLHDAGFLEREKRGTWVYYRVEPRALEAMRAVLEPGPRSTVSSSPA
jgi:ArsR family transcriptional regulator